MADHVCPIWVGYLLASPIRKLFQSPERLLGDWITTGDTVLDIGCAMGFFSIPMARMAGADGRVICVDLQPEMLEKLRQRAERAGVAHLIRARQCGPDSLQVDDLREQVDFALAMNVLHEAGDLKTMMRETYEALRPGGRFMVEEPRGHVSPADFDESLKAAEDAGFRVEARPRSRAAVLVK